MENQNYYEILNLRKDCTSEDIRKAFLELSKKFHPDAAGNTGDQKEATRFIKISEAYQVLSKANLRASYDQDLLAKGSRNATVARGYGMHTTEMHRPWEVKPNYDPNYDPNYYYGVKGVKGRISNLKIALVLLSMAVFGGVIGFVGVRQSYSLQNQLEEEKSEKAKTHHATIRADAEKYGNEEQLRRMVDRMLKEQTR